jgi:hypothetical protein
MHVDTILILRRLVGEIVSEAEHAREFVPGLRIEIGVARAGIDRAMPDADVRHARRVIRVLAASSRRSWAPDRSSGSSFP